VNQTAIALEISASSRFCFPLFRASLVSLVLTQLILIFLVCVLLWIAVAVCSLGSVAAVIQSGSSDGFREPRDTETAISFLENESIASKASMVPLTLIQGADSKGAVCLYGTLPGYHLDRGFGSGANSWLIHLEVYVCALLQLMQP
ncbi:unnamed protein product, partial [Thlaspi arvense]